MKTLLILLCSSSLLAQVTFPGPGRAPVGPVNFSDTFTGALNLLLATHNQEWQSITASYVVGNLKLGGSGTVYVGSSALGGAYHNTSTSDTSQIVVKAASGNVSRAVCVRCGSGTRGYSMNFTTYSGGNWGTINIDKNGVYLGNYTSQTINAAVDHTVKIVASGSCPVTVTVYVDGVAKSPAKTDSASCLAANHPGFFIVGSATTSNNHFGPWQDN